MEVTGVGGKIQQGEPNSLQAGDKLQINVTKSLGDGNYIFNSGGRQFEGFSQTPLGLGPQRIIVLTAEPKIEISLLGKENSRTLQAGSKVGVDIISFKDGLYTVNIGGKTYFASINPPPLAGKFMAELIKTEPALELKPIFTSLKDMTLPLMAKELAAFNQKDLSSIMKMFAGASLTAFLPEEIRRIIKDGGNFFENKLSRGIAPAGDAKTAAYETGNDGARENITKMQIANILMREDFFSFFEGEELDFEGGVMRFRKSDDGSMNLYVKLTFTNLGDTVVSFLKSSEKGFYVTVRTDEDISQALSEISVKGCQINWRKLKNSDKEFFDIKKEDFSGFGSLDVKI